MATLRHADAETLRLEEHREDDLRAVRLAVPQRHGLLRLALGEDPQLRPLRATRRHVRQPLRRQPAVHARAPRPAHRQAQFHAPQLGTARALRQFVSRDDARRGYPHASGDRPPALLRGRRLDVSRPLPHLGLHPRPGIRSVEGDGRAADRAPQADVFRQALRLRGRLETAAARDQQRVHAGGARSLPAALLRFGLRVPRRQPSRRQLVPDARVLRSARAFPGAQALQGAVRARAGTAASSTGRTTRRSRIRPRRSPRSAPTTRRWSRRATITSAGCSTISTRTTCGRTPRSSFPPTTAFFWPSTTGGARICSPTTRRSRISR